MGLFGVLPSFFLLSCIIFLLILIRRRHIKAGNLPPGPTPLPLLGNFLQVNFWNTISSFYKLKEKYGPVFTIYRGSSPVVVLCGYKTVKEAFINNAEIFGDRGPLIEMGDSNKYGMGLSNGERWRQLRRFSLFTLRNFGMGKRPFEERIQEEAQFLVEALQKTQGHPFDPTVYLNHAVCNIICCAVFGNRFEYEDKYLANLVNLISAFLQFRSSPSVQVKVFFPDLMRILPGPHNKLARYLNDLKSFVMQRVQMHRESFDPNCPRGFIDCFLAKMEQEKENPASEFHDKSLSASILNLLIAGTEAVSVTIRYGLLILLRYPEIEAKVQEEIDRVIGRNRSPSMEDRTRMPYTDAVIHEIQRFGDIAPLSLPHLVTSDTQFQGAPTFWQSYQLSCMTPNTLRRQRSSTLATFWMKMGPLRRTRLSCHFQQGKGFAQVKA
ncbi:cytochrome P450 2G1-like isoform X2 [Elgaria multicarinata webbii]|uniref:cytochrome P450 2G1-like isoform X2 n=1 Tax=Elgaria multicarinata webbii TaxID=159646 RepID=UPI002FCCFF78